MTGPDRLVDGAQVGPLVIGATGGSGTRVAARLLRSAGLYLGRRLNASEDALDFGDYSDRWIGWHIRLRPTPGWPILQRWMIRNLEAVVARHLAAAEAPPALWGWKEPRSIYLLPFLAGRFPALKFLHVVRDGRDMAYSPNQNQLHLYGRALLNAEERQQPEPVRSMALWSRVNALAADFGESALDCRYLRIRFEDLCAEPEAVTGHLLGFVGLEANAAELARREVTPPDSLGRWRHADPALAEAVEQAGRAALQRFGYLEAS